MAPQPDGPPTLAAWYQNLLDTKDNPPVFRQLVADLAGLINEGRFDGPREVPERPPR